MINYKYLFFIGLLFLSILVMPSGSASEINSGADFNSYGRNKIALSNTRWAEIIQLFGVPYMSKTAQVSGERHELLYYYYQSPSESQPCPLRLLQIEIRRDVVNGYFFISNLSLDRTTFDEQAITAIQPSRTTKNDIRLIFGPPHGRTLLPSARISAMESVKEIWSYVKSYLDSKSKCGISYKRLDIFFDAGDKVLRVEN